MERSGNERDKGKAQDWRHRLECHQKADVVLDHWIEQDTWGKLQIERRRGTGPSSGDANIYCEVLLLREASKETKKESQRRPRQTRRWRHRSQREEEKGGKGC